MYPKIRLPSIIYLTEGKEKVKKEKKPPSTNKHSFVSDYNTYAHIFINMAILDK